MFSTIFFPLVYQNCTELWPQNQSTHITVNFVAPLIFICIDHNILHVVAVQLKPLYVHIWWFLVFQIKIVAKWSFKSSEKSPMFLWKKKIEWSKNALSQGCFSYFMKWHEKNRCTVFSGPQQYDVMYH